MATRLWWLTVAALVVGLLGLPGLAPPAAGDEGPAVAGAAAPSASPESASTSSTEAPKEQAKGEKGAETPEIEVEVVGKKVGEQPVPSLAPTTGEVVTSINAAELEATGETNLSDALEFLPGVSVTHQGRRYETFVNIRGSSAATFLLDGALISVGGFSARTLYSLPLSAVERVDVVRSSSSLIYGPQALSGGVINIVTKSGKGKEAGQYTSSFEGGSFDYLRGGMSLGQGPADKGLFLAADYDTSNSNLEFGGHRLQRVFLKSDQDLNGGASVKFSLMSIDGRRNFDVWDKEWQAFANMGPAYWGIDPYRDRVATLGYTRPFAKANSGLDLVLWYRSRSYHNFTFGGPIKPKVGQNPFYNEVDDTIGGDLIFRLQAARDHYLRLGMQTYRLNGMSQQLQLLAGGALRMYTPSPSDDRLTGYFAQDEWAISPHTRFFYGGRYEVPMGRKHASTYAFGLEHELSHQATLYAHYGTGVVYPTQSALQSNPNLKDETSGNMDIGVEKHFSPNLMGRVGWFQIAIKNYFVSYLKTGGDPGKSSDYVQVQADFTQSGLEAEFKGAVPSVRSLTYFANYTYMDQKVASIPMAEGRPLQLAVPPKGQASLGLRWAPGRRTRVALSYTHVGDRIARSGYYSMAYPLDGYSYANLTASRELGAGWSLNAAMNNMFDAAYESQPGFPRPGRNFTFGFSRTASMR
jgi:outer membrane receptor protein involved in Fe transport